MLVCPHCRKEVIELVEVLNRPYGCKCDPMEWGEPDNIPPVCDSFKPSVVDNNMCDRCEHNKECHG